MASHQEVALEPVPHRVVTSWPEGTFVENIAVLPDGDLVVSVHSDRELVRVGRTGSRARLAAMPVAPTGLVVDAGRLFVTGGQIGTAPHAVYAVDLAAASGGSSGAPVRRLVEVPGTVFLNGFTPARAGFGYCVDSVLGAVFEIDLDRAAVREVLRHELLTTLSDDPMVPGVNGVVLGPDALWLTNTDRALVLRAGVGDGGDLHGLEVAAEHLRGDDLTLGRDGSLYITTHVHNTLIRLDPAGGRVALAGPEQGMHGATACAFGPPPDDRLLYVTTTGGVVAPVDGVVRPAALVELAVLHPDGPRGATDPGPGG